MRVRGQRHAAAALSQVKRIGTHCTRVGSPLGPVWTGAENLAPPGIDTWTSQPAASRYTDYAALK